MADKAQEVDWPVLGVTPLKMNMQEALASGSSLLPPQSLSKQKGEQDKYQGAGTLGPPTSNTRNG